jgi:putative DNA primase/helicase
MTFLEHARACGLILDYVITDGRWHRCSTADHPRKKNGAYLFDGERGVVRNWATMEGYSAYRSGRVERIDRERLIFIRRQQCEEQAQRQQAARELAQSMLARAGVQSHPYLVQKGFPSENCFVLDGELLIPMREATRYTVLNSLQRISETGEKRFLAGGKAQGSVFCLGRTKARERWLCEGFATGLSVKAALDHLYRDAQVVVCFSAGNIAQVVPHIKQPAFVMADNDESGTGERVSRATGLPWCMPDQVGYDANDVHQRAGLRALVRLIQFAGASREHAA